MLSMHGGVYLCSKTLAHVQARAKKAALICGVVVIVLFAIGGVWMQHLGSYVLVHSVATDAPSNPLHKVMQIQFNQSLANYRHYPWFVLAPICGFLGALLTLLLLCVNRFKCAFVSSALSIFGIIATVGVTLFPVLLPSKTNPSQSLGLQGIVWVVWLKVVRYGIKLLHKMKSQSCKMSPCLPNCLA